TLPRHPHAKQTAGPRVEVGLDTLPEPVALRVSEIGEDRLGRSGDASLQLDDPFGQGVLPGRLHFLPRLASPSASSARRSRSDSHIFISTVLSGPMPARSARYRRVCPRRRVRIKPASSSTRRFWEIAVQLMSKCEAMSPED